MQRLLPSVREVLATPLLAASAPEVFADDEQLARPVRWLHPAEVEDIATLLRGDEVVMTTGLDLSDDQAALRHYVQSLATAGVAGLFLELGRRWQTVPTALVSACAAERLALAVLHREVRFAAVVEEVGAVILDAEVEELRASERVHEAFTRLDVEAAGPEEVLAAVVSLAGLPVVLESTRHQVIGHAAAQQPTTELLADWTRRSRQVVVSGRTGYDPRSGWLTTIVGSRGDDWGRLVLLTNRTPRRRDYSLIERAAATLTLHQMRSRARDSVERTTHASLLAELRARRVTPEVVSRLEAAQLPTRSRDLVAVALRDRGTTQERLWSLNDLAGLLATTTRTLGIPALVSIDTDHVMALLSLAPHHDRELTMARLTRELRKSVVLLVASGMPVHHVADAHITMAEARTVLAAADSTDDREWTTLQDVHLKGLLHLLRDDERLQTFVGRELGRLLAHDAARGSSLLTLLRTLLNARGGKTMAAKQLLLSRPVLYERIARIESVLGVDLDDPQTRTSLHVALLAHELLSDEATGGAARSDNSSVPDASVRRV